jgi:dihydroorotate dehydrogenase (fumarate)
MMELTTTYLGLELKNPIIAGASPLTASLESIKRLEEHGAAAVVMHSLFEEQINHEMHELDHFLFKGSDSYAESLDYFPDLDSYDNLESDDYLDEISQIKESVGIPVIASLNGVSSGGWIKYAKKLEQAGADALELNITYIPTETGLSGQDVEQLYLDDLKAVKTHTSLPVSVKMNPYFSAPAAMAKAFDEAGADGLVLFDRPIHVDIDLESLNATHTTSYTASHDLSESLRWCGILFNKLDASLCASTGVHNHLDIIKAVMSGADATAMVSALLQNGEAYVATVLAELGVWMEEHEYASLAQMKGSVSLHHTSNPAAYQRSGYMKALQAYRN